MKDFGGIQSVFDNAVCPVPGGDGVATKTTGGVDLRYGQKGTSGGELPASSNVTTVRVEGESAPGLKRPSGMAGS